MWKKCHLVALSIISIMVCILMVLVSHHSVPIPLPLIPHAHSPQTLSPTPSLHNPSPPSHNPPPPLHNSLHNPSPPSHNPPPPLRNPSPSLHNPSPSHNPPPPLRNPSPSLHNPSPPSHNPPPPLRNPSPSLLSPPNVRTINEIMLNCTAECVNKGGAMNPFFVHFIKTDPKWEFFEYVAVRSAVKFIKPDTVFVVSMGKIDSSCWWNRTLALPLVKHFMIPVSSDLWVKKIRSITVKERAHFCDFMKQMLLYELGGIFMDTDAIAVRSFDDLKNNQVTVGWDHNGPGYVVNGLMISQRHSCFMCHYTQLSYRQFNGNWGSSGVDPLRSIVRRELSKFKDIRIVGQYTGFFPFSPYVAGWTAFALTNKRDLKVNTTEIYAVHLFHNMLMKSKEKGMRAMKGRTIDKYSWLNTSKSYAGEVFRSVLPKHFTEEQFNTTEVCALLFEDLNYS